MKKYNAPELNIIHVLFADCITTSGGVLEALASGFGDEWDLDSSNG